VKRIVEEAEGHGSSESGKKCQNYDRIK